MPVIANRTGCVLTLLIVSVFLETSIAAAKPPTAGDASPRGVVTRWLELHRTGMRDAAARLTTGSVAHRAKYELRSTPKMTARVRQSLGSERVAAVITDAVNKGSEDVALFWLAWRDDRWQIYKSNVLDRHIVDERLRGFIEADDVHWHVTREELLGCWESDACRPPSVDWTACGSQLLLGDKNLYRMESWGPGGSDPEFNDVMQGTWRQDDGCLVLTHQNATYKCRIEWFDDQLLVINFSEEKGLATYQRMVDACEVSPIEEKIPRTKSPASSGE